MKISVADGDVRYVPAEQPTRDDLSSIAHEGRYRWLIEHIDIRGKTVLDFGCGSGYGAAFLAEKGASWVCGMDISTTSIDYASNTYPKVTFSAHDLTATNLAAVIPERFDVIVSFDVIEHVEKYWNFVDNIQLLLKPGGTAVIGCPNRLTTFDFNRVWNEFHIQEFTPTQLHWLLSSRFKNISLFGQDFSTNKIRARYLVRHTWKSHAKEALRLTPLAGVVRTFKKTLRGISSEGQACEMNSDLPQQNHTVIFTPLPLNVKDSHKRPFGLIAVCQ